MKIGEESQEKKQRRDIYQFKRLTPKIARSCIVKIKDKTDLAFRYCERCKQQMYIYSNYGDDEPSSAYGYESICSSPKCGLHLTYHHFERCLIF